jgi:twitching motility protein PilT
MGLVATAPVLLGLAEIRSLHGGARTLNAAARASPPHPPPVADLRESLEHIALEGVRQGEAHARVSDVQLREGAHAYVRVPGGYALVEGLVTHRPELEQLFAWLAPPPAVPASPPSSPSSPPHWREALSRDPRRSIVRARSLGDRLRLRATIFEHGEADEAGAMALAASIRILPASVPTMESLGLHNFLREWIRCPGLILVTGATGMGKSTTIAALLQYINTDERFGSRNVITLESPIEYRLQSRYCILTQREVGPASVGDFESGIEAALRQRPDILVIGEILTRDAARSALRAASSGHTVIATVHGDSAVGALHSLLGLFHHGEAADAARSLARSLVGVTYQRLVPSLDETRCVLAAEQLTNVEATRRLIEARKFGELDNELRSRGGRTMWTLENDLAGLVRRRMVSPAWAQALASDPEAMERLLRAG